MSQIVINGNNIDILKTYPDNYFDAVVTDPPYGLGKEPNAAELMQDWIEFGYHEVKGTGFMGKEWDAFVPQPVFWKEVFRVLKHGGHVLSFFGTRTYDWGVMSMRFAGFEVRDCIQWLYGSGFPKSHNIGKAIDKIEGNEREVLGVSMNGMSETAMKPDKGWNANSMGKEIKITKGQSEWEGWGTALKPANEPIVLARKPLEKGLSVAENILKWGVGGINIDATRISGIDPNNAKRLGKDYTSDNTNFGGGQIQQRKIASVGGSLEGRFPANIILTHHPECDCKGTKKVKSHNPDNKCNNVGFNPSGDKLYGKGNGITNNKGYAENGEETIEDWDCHEDCPIRILDQQSGVTKSSKRGSHNSRVRTSGDIYKQDKDEYREDNTYGDKGGASRFFYVAKASKSERNKGLDVFETKQTTGGGGTYNEEAGAKYGSIKAEGKNFHPTVKPIKLMQYLVKMITPPNGKVLDPFCGSGTTGIACKLEGYQFVGMEQDAEYSKIAEGRINNYIENPKDYQEDTPETEHSTINNDDKPQLALF